MAQENIVNFYETTDIKNIITIPENGSFIHDTSTNGFYVVKNGVISKLNPINTNELHKEVGVTVIDTEVTVKTDDNDTTNKWSGDSTNGYTKVISNIDNLKATDRPIIDVLLNKDSAENNRNALKSYQCISKIEVTAAEDGTGKGNLTLTALDTKPTNEFTLKIKIIRDNYTSGADS